MTDLDALLVTPGYGPAPAIYFGPAPRPAAPARLAGLRSWIGRTWRRLIRQRH